MRRFHKTIGDSWKVLQGYTMQHKQDSCGYTYLTFTKQVENVIIGIDVKVSDAGYAEISEEYVFDIINEEEYAKSDVIWEDEL